MRKWYYYSEKKNNWFDIPRKIDFRRILTSNRPGHRCDKSYAFDKQQITRQKKGQITKNLICPTRWPQPEKCRTFWLKILMLCWMLWMLKRRRRNSKNKVFTSTGFSWIILNIHLPEMQLTFLKLSPNVHFWKNIFKGWRISAVKR